MVRSWGPFFIPFLLFMVRNLQDLLWRTGLAYHVKMFIQVLIESKEPKVYSFGQSELYVGSSPVNHIVINDSAISKKHLKIIKDGEKWFCNDQGSSNGSYLDDEQLIPGKRVELPVDTSVRLGTKVQLMLLEQ